MSLLYVIQQRTTLNASDLKGDAIHVLQVDLGSALTQASFSQIALPVQSNAHPQGIVIREGPDGDGERTTFPAS